VSLNHWWARTNPTRLRRSWMLLQLPGAGVAARPRRCSLSGSFPQRISSALRLRQFRERRHCCRDNLGQRGAEACLERGSQRFLSPCLRMRPRSLIVSRRSATARCGCRCGCRGCRRSLRSSVVGGSGPESGEQGNLKKARGMIRAVCAGRPRAAGLDRHRAGRPWPEICSTDRGLRW